MRKFLAIAALAATIATPAISRATGTNTPGGTVASGFFSRSDHNTGQWSLIGSFMVPQEIFHFVDGNDDVTCLANHQTRSVVVGPGINGVINLSITSCWPTDESNATGTGPASPSDLLPLAPGANAQFLYSYSDVPGDMNIAAYTVSIDLPTLCIYDRFTGTGTINQL